MTIHVYDNIVQGSDEWLDLRRGIVTASTVGKLVSVRNLTAAEVNCPTCTALAGLPCTSKRDGAAIKTMHPERAGAAREAAPVLTVGDVDDYALALAAERLTGRTEDNYVNNDMMRGIMAEPVARAAYSNSTDVTVKEIGFMVREEDGWSCGWSPDGLVGGKAGIEIKAPRAKAHIKTIITDEVPAQHMGQCQAALLVSGRDVIDFVSFYGGLALYVKPVTPDPAWFAVIEEACRRVETAIAAIVAAYTERAVTMPTTEPLDLLFDSEIRV